MALDQSALLELSEALRTADGGELMRRLLYTMLQALIDAEATAHIGAGPHERTDTRTTQRNGTREKLVATSAGDLTVKIPKVRAGRSSPRCWPRAGGSTSRCTRWSCRPGSRACPPARSMTWSRRWGWSPGSARAR